MSQKEPLKSLEELAREIGRYPIESFEFVREGLQFTVDRHHGEASCQSRHINGADLCWGLRDLAMNRWGMLAPMVLRSWQIHGTKDFGHIVFAMVENGWMAKDDHDSIEDFVDVFDFRSAFAKPTLTV